MLLTEKQTDEWVKWFIETYSKYCTKDEQWRLSIPVIYSTNPERTEKEHMELWRNQLKKIMWRNYNSEYIHKGWLKDTLWEAQLKALWLYNWPTFKSSIEWKCNLVKRLYQIRENMKRLIVHPKGI